MQRQTLQSLLDIPSSRGSDETRKPRLPKSLPSGSQLPSCWNEAMDRAVCHMEAQNEVYASAMVRLLKRRFPELDGVSGNLIYANQGFKSNALFSM